MAALYCRRGRGQLVCRLRRMRSDPFAAGYVCDAALGVLAQATRPALSFRRDIAPRVANHCTTCHRESGDAPFSLTTAGAVRARAATIAAVVGSRYMPPWKPEPGFGEFHGRAPPPGRGVTRIVGVGRGGRAARRARDAADRLDAPARARPRRRTRIVRLPAYRLRADGPDVFRNFVVPVPSDGARFVRGMVFQPHGRAVHHANIRVDPTRASRQLDEADTDAGYEGLILRSADFPDGHFLGWTPGQITPVVRRGARLAVAGRLGPRRAAAPAADRPGRGGRADHRVLLHRSTAGAPPGDAATGPADAGDSCAAPTATGSRTPSCCRSTSTCASSSRTRTFARARSTPGRRCRTDRASRCCASPTGMRAGRIAIATAPPSGSRPAPASSRPMCSTTRRRIRAIPSSRRRSPNGAGGPATRWATSGSRCSA